jgi:Cu(I)/Ag(I) efflux system membrane fusion protein
VGDSLNRAALVLAALLLAPGCYRKAESSGGTPESSAERTPAAATPVKVAEVRKTTLREIVTAPGKTSALAEQKVRAPFAGTLTELRVTEGDRVRRGQVLGTMVARESEAALSGAREMLRQASTPDEKRDAERALALAERNLVRRPLVAAWTGAVLSRQASPGDRVAEDAEILTIEDSTSIVFLADVSQADLARVRPGQAASIELAGRGAPLPATVHGVLPTANPADFTAPVRFDFGTGSTGLTLGLFGSAHATVGERVDVSAVPDAAILRDDVTGVSRVALVTQGRAHWVDVRTGLRDAGRTEITQPVLAEGQKVIVSGLVGLPESQPVLVRP